MSLVFCLRGTSSRKQPGWCSPSSNAADEDLRALDIVSIGIARLPADPRSAWRGRALGGWRVQHAEGDLVVTAPIQYGRLHILSIVSAFLAQHPDISARLVPTDKVVRLVDDHVDVALRIGHLPDSSHVAIKIGTTRHVVCAKPGLPRAPG